MKTHLTKVSLALLAAAFLLGCQEQGSELVGPESLGPEFANAKTKDCPAHPSCKDDGGGGGGGGGETVTVTLTDGMTGSLKFVKVFSDNGKKFAMNTIAQSSGTITMNFNVDTDKCVAEPLNADAGAVNRLKAQLVGAIPDVSSSRFSLFNVNVDRTTDTPTRGNDLQVTYDPDGLGGVILGWAHRDRAAVSEDEDVAEQFVFAGGQIRVGEEDGKPNDRIRILCPSKDVTVTVTR